MLLDIFSNAADMAGVPFLRKTWNDANGESKACQIPITDILSKIDQGWSEEDFQRYDITPRDLRTALTVASLQLPDRPEFVRNNRYKRTKILLDENMSSRLIPELSKELSNLSHIYYEGMSGVTDEFIYWRPWSHLQSRTKREKRAHENTRYIIITQDSDLRDISKAQWKSRVMNCSTPEDIDFSNLNAVFHVRDINLGKPENASYYLPLAKDILRAAYSEEASSYVITKSGVYPEQGCRLEDIIEEVEKHFQFERIKSSQITDDDARYLEMCREVRERRRRPNLPELAAA